MRQSSKLQNVVACEVVGNIWNNLEIWIYEKCGILLNYNQSELLFGKIGTQFCVPHLIVLLMKKYIYKKRCQEEILNFESVKNIVKDYHNTEKYIFATNGILNKFDRKWNLYKNLFKKNNKKLQQY